MALLSTPNWIAGWFRGAAIYGVLALAVAVATVVPAEPRWFWGFAGTALAFQIGFWVIGGDPVRYRALMPAAAVEKLAFVLPSAALLAAGRLDGAGIAAAAIDAALGIGFLVAWRATPAAP